AGEAPDSAGIVLVTDGRFHDDWRASAQALGAAVEGKPMRIVPRSGPPADVRIAAFTARRTAPGKVTLRVTVASNAAARRQLTVSQGSPHSRQLLTEELTLRAGDRVTLHASTQVPAGGSAAFAARLSPGDPFEENDAMSAAVLPVAPSTLAILSDPSLGWVVAKLDQPRLLPADEAPQSIADLRDVQLAVVVDPLGTALAEPARKALAAFARAGGGVVCVGSGPRTSPADANGPLNRVLPLVCNPYQRRPLHLVVALDASGSMAAGGSGRSRRRKFDLAIEAVMSLRRHVTARDRLTVWTFADKPAKAYDSGNGRPNFAALRESLLAVKPTGGTDAGKAIAAAARVQLPEQAEGLLLVLSDLQTRELEPAKLAGDIKDAGVRLAVVAVGSAPQTHLGAGQLLQLTRLSDAPLIRQDDLGGLAKVFASLVRGSRGEGLQRGTFSISATDAVFGVAADRLPSVRAYLPAVAREGAQVLARIGDDPVIARRSVALGRTVSVALPAGEAGLDGAAKSVLAQVVNGAGQWGRRTGGDPRFETVVDRSAGGITVTVRARDPWDGPINDLSLTAAVQEFTGGRPLREQMLAQVGPGEYRGKLPAVPGEAAMLVYRGDGAVLHREAIGRSYPREFASLGADMANLRELATLTGGRIARDEAVWQEARRWTQPQRVSVAWALLLGALACMLADWALTRVTR
ncbi:MAG: vWA domain-containing protein, partial [Phycisphaerae bacterium]